MNPLLFVPLLFGPPAAQRWAVELELEAIGGDIDVLTIDAGGNPWLAVTGTTNREGRARLYQRDDDGTWLQRWEGPTATDLDLTSQRSGEVYFGFNRPMSGYQPTLLRVGPDGVTPLEVPLERLDQFEYRQVGAYYLWSDTDGWACGQEGGLWRRTAAGWESVTEIFDASVPASQRYGYKLYFEDRYFGLQTTLGGRAASWDGHAWHPVEPPPGRSPRFLHMSHGLALDDEGWLRFGRSGWVELEDACESLDAADIAMRRPIANEAGTVAVYGDYVFDLGSTAWTCRLVGIPFAKRAVAAHEGALWVLSDDALRRAVDTAVPTFVPSPADSLPPGLWHPTIVDLDDDGDDDVIVAASADSNRLPSSGTEGVLAIWRAQGGGAYAREAVDPQIGVRVMARQVAAADYDGDDDLDLAVLEVGEGLRLLRDVGGAWGEAEPVGEGVHQLSVFDLEGDGDADLSADLHIYVNDGAGRFHVIDHPADPDNPAAALGHWFDHDLDGDADFVSHLWRQPSSWLRNDGTAGFTPIPLGIAVEAATVADGNGDGRPDVLAQRLHYHHLAMPFRRCGLVEDPPCSLSDLSSVPSGIVGDLDRDGRDDRIVGSLRVYETPPGTGSVYMATDDGWSEATAMTGRFVHAHLLDADGDGDLDVYTRDGGLSVNTTDPQSVVRLRLRTARSDRRAEGAWVVLRDTNAKVVAAGPARAGAVVLGVPDPSAVYSAEITFPTGTRKTVDRVTAGSTVDVTELGATEHRVRVATLWWHNAWRLARFGRDGLLLLLSIVSLAIALRRLKLDGHRRLALSSALVLALTAASFAVRRGGPWPWLAAPLAASAGGLLAWLRQWQEHRTAARRAGPYTLLERIGEGSAAEVWRARREGEEVALKLFAAEPMQHAETRERFFREARIGAELSHPNLVRIGGSGQLDDGRCYLAMERVEGTSLDAKLTDPVGLDASLVRRIVRDIARALEALHDAGVIHRDVKPGNVVLRPDDSAVLMDLGLARSALFKTVTRHDLAVGTLAYMSPEQSLGRPLDGRTDLWSLGVLTYELLTGRRPFDGSHELELVYMIHNVAATPLRDVTPDAPDDLVTVVERCLERDPNARIGSAQAVIDLLQFGEPAQPGG